MLPFDPETLHALHGRHLTDLAPAVALAWLGALALLASAFLPRDGRAPRAGWIGALLLALLWGWTAWAWFDRALAPLFFAAGFFAALFGLQALLLAEEGLLRGRLLLRFAGGMRGWGGVLLALYGLAGHALLHLAAGGAWPDLPLLGLAPGPLALFTLGLLLLVPPPARIWPLAIVPLLWCLLAGIQAWGIGMPADYVQPLLGLAALVLLCLPRQRRQD